MEGADHRRQRHLLPSRGIVEEPRLQYSARLGEARNRVDSPLALTVDVRVDKQRVDGPVTATATIARPRVAVGNLLGDNTPSDARLPELEPGMTLAERRLASLAIDGKRWKELAPASGPSACKATARVCSGLLSAMSRSRVSIARPCASKARTAGSGRSTEAQPSRQSCASAQPIVPAARLL